VKGGKEKAARFEPMKTEIIRLLHVKSSPEGWLHKKDALRDIEDEINDYIAIHGWPQPQIIIISPRVKLSFLR
jgi:hypothetical protein